MLYQCIRENNLGIGHCFVHYYGDDFSRAVEMDAMLINELERYELEADIILGEWNYLSPEGGFENLTTTFLALQTPFIAAWYAQQLIYMQAAEDLVGAVYYVTDMPGAWTGLYKLDSAGDVVRLPAYDVFKNFGELYRLGNEIAPDNLPAGISALAASDGKEMGILIVNGSEESKETSLVINNIQLDTRTITIDDEERSSTSGKLPLTLAPYEVIYVRIR